MERNPKDPEASLTRAPQKIPAFGLRQAGIYKFTKIAEKTFPGYYIYWPMMRDGYPLSSDPLRALSWGLPACLCRSTPRQILKRPWQSRRAERWIQFRVSPCGAIEHRNSSRQKGKIKDPCGRAYAEEPAVSLPLLVVVFNRWKATRITIVRWRRRSTWSSGQKLPWIPARNNSPPPCRPFTTVSSSEFCASFYDRQFLKFLCRPFAIATLSLLLFGWAPWKKKRK